MMLVDVSSVLLGGAAAKLQLVRSGMLDPHAVDDLTSDPRQRAFYYRNRAETAARWLSEAVELIRIYWTKVPAA